MSQDVRWRWLLTDALAHGRKWYNPLHSSFVDTPEYTALHEQYEEEGDLRAKLNIAKLMAKLLGNKLAAFYCGFNHVEAAKILKTPRFDISDAFIKADIPDSQEDYFAKLPSLAIPFPEFWIEWQWSGDNRTAHFCCRIVSSYPLEDGYVRLKMTTFAWLPRDDKQDESCLKYEATAFLSADRKIERLLVEGEHTKSEGILMFPCIHAMALLGCKNVKTTEMRAPRPLRRNVERTFGVALCSYRVVTIVQGKKQRGSEVSKHHAGGRAMSICRGHFKTYDEHGLFGNKKGTWWWQDHVRGEYECGVVVKDYALQVKKDEVFQ